MEKLKKFLITSLVLVVCLTANAQKNPVSWTFSAKKISDKTYELHITASMQSGWHLYSQAQPDDAIAEPTKITFNKNPLLILDGKIKEDGKLEKFHDERLKVSANQYSSKVEFVQTVKLKTSAKTKIGGSVRFQTCDDVKCLRPETVNFSVAL